MKVGIVVPFSWSYWGGVVEHAEHQADALRRRGHDVKILMGNDPPGRFTRLLHPRSGRHGELPDGIIPVGRSVVVPANGSLPNIVLSPRSVGRIRRILEEEQFDVVHLHEPMTPAVCVATLALAKCPIVVMGKVEGDVTGPVIHVTPSGVVSGVVKVKQLRSDGELAGEVEADTVEISGRVRDRTVIRARSLEVSLSVTKGGMQVVFGDCERTTFLRLPVSRVIEEQLRVHII